MTDPETSSLSRAKASIKSLFKRNKKDKTSKSKSPTSESTASQTGQPSNGHARAPTHRTTASTQSYSIPAPPPTLSSKTFPHGSSMSNPMLVDAPRTTASITPKIAPSLSKSHHERNETAEDWTRDTLGAAGAQAAVTKGPTDPAELMTDSETPREGDNSRPSVSPADPVRQPGVSSASAVSNKQADPKHGSSSVDDTNVPAAAAEGEISPRTTVVDQKSIQPSENDMTSTEPSEVFSSGSGPVPATADTSPLSTVSKPSAQPERSPSVDEIRGGISPNSPDAHTTTADSALEDVAQHSSVSKPADPLANIGTTRDTSNTKTDHAEPMVTTKSVSAASGSSPDAASPSQTRDSTSSPTGNTAAHEREIKDEYKGPKEMSPPMSPQSPLSPGATGGKATPKMSATSGPMDMPQF